MQKARGGSELLIAGNTKTSAHYFFIGRTNGLWSKQRDKATALNHD